jgi:hypothetical protein
MGATGTCGTSTGSEADTFFFAIINSLSIDI